jgi:hypothetical protein
MLRVACCALRVTCFALRVACFALRVASYALRGENQTNPKYNTSVVCHPFSVFCHLSSDICPLASERRFPGLGSFQIFFLLFFLFGCNQLFQVFNKINGNLILGISELIRHLGDD